MECKKMAAQNHITRLGSYPIQLFSQTSWDCAQALQRGIENQGVPWQDASYVTPMRLSLLNSLSRFCAGAEQGMTIKGMERTPIQLYIVYRWG